MAKRKPKLPEALEEKMQLAQEGNEQAYGAVLREICVPLRGFLIKRLGDRAQVEDVLQETLLSIHRVRHTYDPARPLMPWVYAIANFRLKDYFRKYYRSAAHEQVDIDEIKEILPDTVTAPDRMGELALEGLEQLPAREQKIVKMLKLEGFSAQEIGLELNMSTTAVKVAAHRAYRKLRSWIEKHHEDK